MKESHGISNLAIDEPLVFERGSAGRCGVDIEDTRISKASKGKNPLPAGLLRSDIEGFPELSQIELVRHFLRLSQYNYSVDTGFYPLGSCTMKYNPKVNEDLAALEGFSSVHPEQPAGLSQGALELMYRLERCLAEITGMDRVSLQPAAGAHGELTGMMIIKAFFRDRGTPRGKVLIPDTAHGTNPASVAMCGFTAVPVPSGPDGIIQTDDVRSRMDEDTAAIMMTNPNTLGIFECNVAEIADVVHKRGGFVYFDGANLNALMGIVRFGDIGCDLMHLNLHKTFSTPHGGGGPGAGPLAVKEELAQYLPVPLVDRSGGEYTLVYDRPKSIGKVKSFFGNFLICLRAYAYILALGADGLRKASEYAVLNANYLRKKLESSFHLPYRTETLHECVFSDRKQQEHGISTLDIAKRLIDHGFHPPTIYFPLVVKGALMVEPTETETLETLDRFVDAMRAVAEEARETPALLKKAPQRSKITRVDEVAAARKPVLRWRG
jgi:glycine dehydrogenase subunit 2